jgi:hypothetical protein
VKRIASLALMFAALIATARPALAATYPIDDSASLPGEAQVQMRWRTFGPSRRSADFVDGATVVTLRLNTARWVHHVGRIYMVLPAQPQGPVTVEWATQGRLLPGSLQSGDRTLVYAGPINAPMLEDTIRVQVHTDGRRLVSAQRLQFHFEIDVE